MSLDTHVTASPRVAMESLLAHRNEIRQREEQLSYWRRVVQGRLDLLTARLEGTGHEISLAHVLGVDGQSSSRAAHVEVRHITAMPALASSDVAWELASSSDDVELVRRTVDQLVVAERWLSDQRAAVLADLDEATAELATRLSEDPADYLRSVERRWVASAG